MGKVSDHQIQNGCVIPKEKPTKTGQKLCGEKKPSIMKAS